MHSKEQRTADTKDPHRRAQSTSNTKFLVPTRVSFSDRTSIRLAVFVEHCHVTPRLTDAPRYGIGSRSRLHLLMHVIRPRKDVYMYFLHVAETA